jgi:hypothetical protein
MLSSIVIPRHTVEAGVGTFAVRGLTFADLSRLVADHRAEIEEATEIVTASGDDMGAIAAAIAGKLPRLASAVIACAADEPDMASTAALLPIPVQLDALVAVGRLTFADEGALPKFLANLQSLTAGLATLKK